MHISRQNFRRVLIAIAVILCTGPLAYIAFAPPWVPPALAPRGLADLSPRPRIIGKRTSLEFPGKTILARVAQSSQDTDAYRRLISLRQRPVGAEVGSLIAVRALGGPSAYDILLRLNDDAIGAVELAAIARLDARVSTEVDWFVVADDMVRLWESQTRLLDSMLKGARLERRPSVQPPQSTGEEPILALLVELSRRYSIPYEIFRHFDRFDTEYIDEDGSIRGARWLADVPAGHAVLYRSGERILAIRGSDAHWRVTEEAMRYAHSLYYRDVEQGRSLPDELSPPKSFKTEVSARDAVTYASCLARDLLDRCGGDLSCATRAMAADSDDPNIRMDIGVRRVALYARRTIEHAGAVARAAAGDRH